MILLLIQSWNQYLSELAVQPFHFYLPFLPFIFCRVFKLSTFFLLFRSYYPYQLSPLFPPSNHVLSLHLQVFLCKDYWRV